MKKYQIYAWRERETENWLSNTYAHTEPFQTNTGFNLLTQTWQKKLNDSIIQTNDILEFFVVVVVLQNEMLRRELQ